MDFFTLMYKLLYSYDLTCNPFVLYLLRGFMIPNIGVQSNQVIIQEVHHAEAP